MGQNLILNMADHGFNVAAHNRTTSKVDNFLAREENFIWIENDENIIWIDRESLVSIEKLQTSSNNLLKPRVIDYQTNTNRDTGICS